MKAYFAIGSLNTLLDLSNQISYISPMKAHELESEVKFSDFFFFLGIVIGRQKVIDSLRKMLGPQTTQILPQLATWLVVSGEEKMVGSRHHHLQFAK